MFDLFRVLVKYVLIAIGIFLTINIIIEGKFTKLIPFNLSILGLYIICVALVLHYISTKTYMENNKRCIRESLTIRKILIVVYSFVLFVSFVMLYLNFYFFGALIMASSFVIIVSWFVRGCYKNDITTIIYLSLLIGLGLSIYTFLKYPYLAGNDTFRDLIYARNTLLTGHYNGDHPAYPVSFTVFLYSILELIYGANTNNLMITPLLFGGVYLIALTLLGVSIMRILKLRGTLIPILFTFNQLIILWILNSFVPYSLALIYVAIYVYTLTKSTHDQSVQKPAYVLLTLLSYALTISHSGMAIYLLGLITSIYVFSYVESYQNSRNHSTMHTYGYAIILLLIVVSTYVLYTTVISMVRGTVTTIIDVLLTIFIKGSNVKIIVRDIPSIAFIFMYSTLALFFGVSTAAFISDKNLRDKSKCVFCTFYIFSMALSIVGLLSSIDVLKNITKYMWVPSFFLLSLITSRFYELSSNYSKKVMAYIILPMMVFSTLLGGILIPDLDILGYGGTVNIGMPTSPYELYVSQYLMNYNGSENIIVDLHLGKSLVLMNVLNKPSIEVKESFHEVYLYTPYCFLNFKFLGYYGFLLNKELLSSLNEDTILILRPYAIEYMQLSEGGKSKIADLVSNENRILSGKDIIAIQLT